MRIALTWLLSTWLLSACASGTGAGSSHASPPRQLFDERSGSTLLIVGRPIVLARSRSDVAANVHDYVTLIVAQEDISGKYASWLIAYRWSTVDPRFDPAHALASGRLALIADGRTISLTPSGEVPAFLQRRDLLPAPHHPINTWAYAMDVPTLRYLALTRDLALRWQDDALPLPYSVWEEGRPELLALMNGSANAVERPQRH